MLLNINYSSKWICYGEYFFLILVQAVSTFTGHGLFVKAEVPATLTSVSGTWSPAAFLSRRFGSPRGTLDRFWGKGGVPPQLEAFHCTLTGGLRQREVRDSPADYSPKDKCHDEYQKYQIF
jgi:hypothetical protein